MIIRLVGGPEVTLAYVAAQPLWPPFDPEYPEFTWVLEDSFNGGAVIDQTRRELVWFCGDCDYLCPSHLPLPQAVFPAATARVGRLAGPLGLPGDGRTVRIRPG